MFDKDSAAEVRALIESYKLPASLPKGINLTDTINAMKVDKKVQSGKMRFILPEMMGVVSIVDDVDEGLIREVLEA
jgi:3-dehydroquinate synthase